MRYGLISEDELRHYGVKGQKWGRRQYQNKDGSLTPAGKERYGSKKKSKPFRVGKAFVEAFVGETVTGFATAALINSGHAGAAKIVSGLGRSVSRSKFVIDLYDISNDKD